jgi:hypothetical protein
MVAGPGVGEVLGEIYTLGELVRIGGCVRLSNEVLHEPSAGLVRERDILEELLRDRVETGSGNAIIRKWSGGQRQGVTTCILPKYAR